MSNLIKKLHTEDEFNFEVKENLRLGTMRVDFSDGSLANTWLPSESMEGFINKYDMAGVEEIQKVVNEIQFELIDTFAKVQELCNGYGYDHQTNMYVSYGKCNYWIKLVPVQGDYNYYIKVYIKEELLTACA